MNILWTLTDKWKNHRWQRMFIDLSRHKEVGHIYVIERSYDILTYPLRGWQKRLPAPIPIYKMINPKLSVIRYPLLYPEKLDYANILPLWVSPLVNHIKPDIAIVSSPFHIPWAIPVKKHRKKVIYFVYDEILYSEEGKPRKDTLRFEQKLVSFVDAIVVTSPTLIKPRRIYNKPIFLRPNGTDTSLWRGPHKEPAFLKNISKPRIVFHGHMGPWINVDLFKEVAVNMPYANFIVIGKISPKAKEKIQSVSNIHTISFKPQVEVAAAVWHSNISFMPFKMDDQFSEAINPLKLYESLAAGVPAVISQLPAVPDGPGIYKYNDNNTQMVIQLLTNILTNPPNRKELQKFALHWDWHYINKKMLRIIGGVNSG